MKPVIEKNNGSWPQSGSVIKSVAASRRALIDLVLFATLALLWGASYLFIKVAVADIPPMMLMAVRVSVAALFLLGVVFWRSERLPRDRKTWGGLLVLAFCNSIGAWTLLAWSLQSVDSGLASVLNSTSPIFVFLITLLCTGHEAVSGRKLVGAGLGLGGVVLIVGVDVLAGLGQQVVGQLAAVSGAVLYACAAIYGKSFFRLSASVIAASTMSLATCVLVPLSLVLDRPWTLNPSMQSVSAALVLSVLCTAVALMIYFRLLRTLESLGVASQAYLRAGVGVVLGTVFLGERLTPLVALGLVTALAGVVLINSNQRRRPKSG